MARGRQNFRNFENEFSTESRSDEMISMRSFAGTADVETVQGAVDETGGHENGASGHVTVPWGLGGSFGGLNGFLNFGSYGGSFRNFANFEFGDFVFDLPFTLTPSVLTPDAQAPARAGLGSINYEYTGDIGVLQTDLLTRDLSAEGGLQAALDHTDVYHLTNDGAASPSGTGLSDTVVGGTGNDTIFGMSGNDVVLGGAGQDTLYGNSGDDMIYGDGGNDTLSGDAGADTLVGGTGTNALDGGTGVDTAVYEGSYLDYVISFSGSDVTVKSPDGTTVNDTLTGIERLRFGSDLYSVEALQSASAAGTVPDPLDIADTPTMSLPGTITAAFPNGTDTLRVPLDISAALTDTDGSETLHVRVSGLPTGATLSAGAAQSDGSWLLSAGDIAGVTIDLPPSVASDFQLAIVAEAQESADGSIAVVDGVVTVDVVAWAGGQSASAIKIPAAGQDIPGPFEGGNVLWVGAGQQYANLQDAVDASGTNDTIYIAAGTYDFKQVMIDHDINIIGVGEVILTAADKVYKGILVTTGGTSLYVENITFKGVISWDQNGAGIRHQGSDLTVVNSNFNQNQNGILATGDTPGDITIIGSSFVENGHGDGYSHGIYIKVAHVLRVEDSEFVGTKIGHHIKSMAAATVVRNSILDQADGQGSYSIDVTKGGDLLVEGNTIIQSADASNGTIISYYVTRGGEPGQVILSQNSITNLKDGGILLKNGTDAIAQIEGNTITNSSANALTLSFGLADKISNVLNGTPVADESFDEFAISGTSGADVLQGTSAADVLSGNSGADHISGDAGRDLILGGDGNDWINGGRDNDIIGGGAGNDVLIDGSGGDFLLGGDGADVFIAGLGKDYYNGGAGVDVAIFHHNYSDYTRVWQDEPGVRTYVRATEESGEYGSKSMTGVEYLQFRDGIYNTSTAVFTQNAFVIDPTVLADIESGAKLDFSIYASSSDDEVFVAGSGNDTFIFGAGSFGSDSIIDFDILNDRLLIDSSHASSMIGVTAAAYGDEDGLVLDFGSGDLIKLPGLTIGDIPNLDIDFG